MSAPQLPVAPPSAPVPAPKGSNGLAVAGFILGLLALLGSFIPVVNIGAIILAVIGLVLAGVGLARAKAARAGKGLAITGLVLGALAIIIAIVIDVSFGKAVDDAVDKATSTTVDTGAKASGTATASAGGDATSELGKTRANPAPLGSAISGDDWTVRVDSVEKIAADSIGQNAASGKVLLQVTMTATYNGHDSQGDSAWASMKYVAPNGTSFDSTSGSTMFLADKEFDSLKTLYHGGSATGDQIIEVPASNWKAGVLAVSPGMLSDDTFLSLE
jgi:hypothetical protein